MYINENRLAENLARLRKPGMVIQLVLVLPVLVMALIKDPTTFVLLLLYSVVSIVVGLLSVLIVVAVVQDFIKKTLDKERLVNIVHIMLSVMIALVTQTYWLVLLSLLPIAALCIISLRMKRWPGG